MNNQFEKMQKLAFGKVVQSSTPETLTENKGALKDKIKEIIHSTLGEAKKKKKKDVAPQEDVDINIDTEETPLPDETSTDDTLAPTDMDGGSEVDIDPKVKSVQDYLQKAYANAKELGDEKLMTQIGNTITMVVRNQVLGGQAVAESLEEMVGDLGKYDYLSNALNHVWNMGRNNNSIDFDDMAGSIIDDLESRFTESLEEMNDMEYESADFTRGYDTGYKEGYKDGFDQASEEY